VSQNGGSRSRKKYLPRAHGPTNPAALSCSCTAQRSGLIKQLAPDAQKRGVDAISTKNKRVIPRRKQTQLKSPPEPENHDQGPTGGKVRESLRGEKPQGEEKRGSKDLTQVPHKKELGFTVKGKQVKGFNETDIKKPKAKEKRREYDPIKL